jgi:Rrf2 family protein
MRVSQRLDYALRALVLLAEQPAESWVVAGDLAERLQLPRRFVEQQITQLSRAGIVTCRRGASGGCALSRPPESITVAQVVVALNGEVLDVPHQPGLATAEVWRQALATLSDYLDTVTLAELAERQRELDAEAGPMYYI